MSDGQLPRSSDLYDLPDDIMVEAVRMVPMVVATAVSWVEFDEEKLDESPDPDLYDGKWLW